MKFKEWDFIKESVPEDETLKVERAIHEKVSLELKFENPLTGKEPVVEIGDAVLLGIKEGTNDQLFMVDNGLNKSVSVTMGVDGPEYAYTDAAPTYVVVDVSELYSMLSKQEIISVLGDALVEMTMFKRSMNQLTQIKEQLNEHQ